MLPSWLGFHAEKTDGDNKYGVMIGFQPGIDSGNQGAITGSPLDGGLGLNSENLRQVYLEWSGNWGGIKIGRDIGLFGSDAILSDMPCWRRTVSTLREWRQTLAGSDRRRNVSPNGKVRSILSPKFGGLH